jgi:hypothetical protein
MNVKILGLLLTALLACLTFRVSGQEKSRVAQQAADQKHKPIIVEMTEQEVKTAFAAYQKEKGTLPVPQARRRINCQVYGPVDCAILLGQRAPWGCMVCCRCSLPRPTGQ